ncbi:MAG TPA: ATP-binding protein [Actinomycetota bacterium]
MDATSDVAGAPLEAPERTLRGVERERRHLWWAATVFLTVLAAVVLVMSYWTDVVPEPIHDVIVFPGVRFTLLALSLGFGVYAIAHDRSLARLTRQIVAHERELARLQAELERQRVDAARLTEADRVRADAIAGVTHQVKTPLTSLLGYVAILRKRAGTLGDEETLGFLAVMEEQGRRIVSLIEDLLQSSRAEAGLTRLLRVPVDLGKVVTRLAAELGDARERTIEVDTPRGDLGLYGDPSALEHVVTNLLDNALKYSEPGTVVRARVTDDRSEVFLTVADEGRGIAPGELPHIFERFRQASNARGSGSVGFGLYLVRTLVEAHGGRVWVESRLGEGTSFHVALPRRQRER